MKWIKSSDNLRWAHLVWAEHRAGDVGVHLLVGGAPHRLVGQDAVHQDVDPGQAVQDHRDVPRHISFRVWLLLLLVNPKSVPLLPQTSIFFINANKPIEGSGFDHIHCMSLVITAGWRRWAPRPWSRLGPAAARAAPCSAARRSTSPACSGSWENRK